ncbi:MAG: hypothetical protein JO010_11040, partial [Alphaproteobacteria bacterium]|nr:hypothetical protein [Alphaproteobacteria bacterium]
TPVVPGVEGWDNALAQYRQTPLSRAMTVNISADPSQPYRYYWVWGRASPDAAASDAMAECNESISADHTKLGGCLVMATDNTVLLKREELTPDRFHPH